MSDAGSPQPGAVRREVDAKGLLCPLPVIRLQDAVVGLAAGALVDLLATDPGVLQDVPAWCAVHGHRVVATRSADGCIRIRVEVCDT